MTPNKISEGDLPEDAADYNADRLYELASWISDFRPHSMLNFSDPDAVQAVSSIDPKLVWVVYNDGNQFLAPLEGWSESYGVSISSHVNGNGCFVGAFFICASPITSKDIWQEQITVESSIDCSYCSEGLGSEEECPYCKGEEFLWISVWDSLNRDELNEIVEESGEKVPDCIPAVTGSWMF